MTVSQFPAGLPPLPPVLALYMSYLLNCEKF